MRKYVIVAILFVGLLGCVFKAGIAYQEPLSYLEGYRDAYEATYEKAFKIGYDVAYEYGYKIGRYDLWEKLMYPSEPFLPIDRDTAIEYLIRAKASHQPYIDNPERLREGESLEFHRGCIERYEAIIDLLQRKY